MLEEKKIDRPCIAYPRPFITPFLLTQKRRNTQQWLYCGMERRCKSEEAKGS